MQEEPPLSRGTLQLDRLQCARTEDIASRRAGEGRETLHGEPWPLLESRKPPERGAGDARSPWVTGRTSGGVAT